MNLSAHEFAAALPVLRPQLHSMLTRKRPWVQSADAEDLVEDAICLALEKIANYRPENGPLLPWLKGFLQIVLMRDRRDAQHTVPTVPLETAVDVPAPRPVVGPRDVLRANIAALPEKQRWLVGDWLDGYSQRDLVGMYDLSRNTVAIRLASGFAGLRMACPDGGSLGYSTSDFDFCSKVIVYHKPPGSCGRWMRDNPRDVRIRLGNTERRPQLRRDPLASRNIRDRRVA